MEKRKKLPRIAKDLMLKQVRPGYSIDFHPRAFSKPLSCQMGVHKGFVTRIINGVLSLYCTKCGVSIAQGVYDKTWTKEEIRKIKEIQRISVQPKTKKELMKDSWEALELLRKKYTDEEIRRLIARYKQERGIP